MGFYIDQIEPRIMDRACGSRTLQSWRRRTTEGLEGDVVEIGFGTGHNVPFYPPRVRLVYAVEPSTTALRISESRIKRSTVEVVPMALRGETVPLDDESCDGAICTFTLCSVADPVAVVNELHRLLRPGASLHFLEHGISPDASVSKWQHRLDPWQGRLANGCHLTRDATALIAGRGFGVDVLDQRYAKGPKPWSYLTVGRATKH